MNDFDAPPLLPPAKGPGRWEFGDTAKEQTDHLSTAEDRVSDDKLIGKIAGILGLFLVQICPIGIESNHGFDVVR